MDPITTAVLAALPLLATGAIKDAYEGLKAVIRRKWGDAAPLTKAVKSLEEDPTSGGQAAVLSEKVKATKATEDPEVVQALYQLVEELKAQGGTTAQGVRNIEFKMTGGNFQGVGVAETVSVENMVFNAQPKVD